MQWRNLNLGLPPTMSLGAGSPSNHNSCLLNSGLSSFKALPLTQLHRQEWNCIDGSLEYYCSSLGQLLFSGIHLFLCGQNLFPLKPQSPPTLLSALSYRSHEGIFCHLGSASSENLSSFWEANSPQELFCCWSLGLCSGHGPGQPALFQQGTWTRWSPEILPNHNHPVILWCVPHALTSDPLSILK